MSSNYLKQEVGLVVAVAVSGKQYFLLKSLECKVRHSVTMKF